MDTQATMNGATVLARWRETVFIRIPRELQAPCAGGCGCDWCKAHPEAVPMWDTLCVGTEKPKTGNDYCWTVHCPDPSYLWEAERKALAKLRCKEREAIAA